MTDTLLRGLNVLGETLEIVGSGALIFGFVIATVRCFRQYFRQEAIFVEQEYRQSLGRVVLIGLEILVAATIIKMIALNPTTKNMGLLVIMVAIRTILGWTMALEMNGRWPWQRGRSGSSKLQKKQY